MSIFCYYHVFSTMYIVLNRICVCVFVGSLDGWFVRFHSPCSCFFYLSKSIVIVEKRFTLMPFCSMRSKLNYGIEFNFYFLSFHLILQFSCKCGQFAIERNILLTKKNTIYNHISFVDSIVSIFLCLICAQESIHLFNTIIANTLPSFKC